MEDGLREKVGLLRERIKRSGDDRDLYRELSDLLFQAGKISAAMNILERSLEAGGGEPGAAAADGASASRGKSEAGGPPHADPHAPLMGLGGREGKWLFDRGLEFADAYLYEDAVECFLLALESGLETFETHYCLAGVYKSLEKPGDAERHCRRSIEINSRFAPAHILLGSILKSPGRLEESVACCKRAVLLDPDCLAAYYDLACYYSLLGRREQSLAAMEMALCKGFTDFDWLLKDPDLEALRRNPEFDLLIRSYREKSL
jgi:tetratricopeptide (TPR) repeat protein